MDENTWLVAGLGNPGPGYSGNRHNVGQMVLDELADRLSATFKTHKAGALVAEGRPSTGSGTATGSGTVTGSGTAAGRPKLILGKPGTFMNLSGRPVAALLKFYSLDASRLIVIHDELDLPFDTVKLKQGGGHGGHNGLRDIISAIGTPDFTRVRVGIGRPPGRQDAADFVLRDFSSTEKKSLPNLLTDAADAAEHIATEGLASAQLRFHTSS